MCGIAGFVLGVGDWARERLTSTAEAMACRLEHRGPDDGGSWADPAAGVGLGHRRLSIVDLSPAGHQPMTSISGRWVIVYNGELYNTEEVRRPLESSGVQFRGHSDTEVLLAAIEDLGVEPALEQINGMFAFAVWDRKERQLWLARDRLGEKPLYYGWARDTFIFASELKALRCHPHFGARVDRTALSLFMTRANVPAPNSIYEGIFKLPPGCLLAVATVVSPGSVRPRPYWSADETVVSGVATPRDLSTDELSSLLLDAVQRRTVADVPLGGCCRVGSTRRPSWH